MGQDFSFPVFIGGFVEQSFSLVDVKIHLVSHLMEAYVD